MVGILLDLFFPKRCVFCGKFGAYFCPKCKAKIQYLENQYCPECARPSISGTNHPVCQRKYSLNGLISAFYFAGPIRDAIHKLKYKLVSDLAEELIDLALSNKELTTILCNIVTKDFNLVPVPLHSKRERWRGFNQAKVLGSKIARKLEISLSEGILKRTKDTTPQVELKRKERIKNVARAFEVSSKEKVVGKNILLVDDVATTSATLKACANALKRAGASSVWALTLARQKSFEGKSKI